ncbi:MULTISPECIES: hypothetical protein [unclassified Haladaptatus]|uniref:DUF7536 family protein n=1 Tax=unclassified Haladaptatus TaxID=2622732 RepID=UPI0023E873FF|nr:MULTISPECIES: hypothetical protein [unclassified Haladaptatus]
MTDERSRSPRANMVDALNVPQNARRGFAFGVLATVAIFVFFVILPGTFRSPFFYIALGFVLATSLGAFATVILVLRSAYRLSRES